MGKSSHHIEFEWICGGNEYHKRLYKLKMYDDFSIKGNIDPPYNSKEICKEIMWHIEHTIKITVNKDINRTLDVPMVIFETTEGTKAVPIRRGCKAVWAVFDKYCSE